MGRAKIIEEKKYPLNSPKNWRRNELTKKELSEDGIQVVLSMTSEEGGRIDSIY